MSDLVAFEVEGSGYYLVPLGALAGYEIVAPATDAIGVSGISVVPVGWGWTLPIVRWNTFHSSQIGTAIALAPGVIAALVERHFIALTTEGNPPCTA